MGLRDLIDLDKLKMGAFTCFFSIYITYIESIQSLFLLFQYLCIKLGFNTFRQSCLIYIFFDFDSTPTIFTLPLHTSFLLEIPE